MLGQTFSTWEIEKYWQSGTSLGEKHHATPCADQENVEICRRGWHSWDGFFETWTTGCAFSPLLVQGFSRWTMYSGVCCLRCDVFSRKSLQVQRGKPLNQRSKQLTFYTILSFMHGHPAVFVVGSGIRIRPSHVSEATPEQGILNKNGVQCVFLGLASPFLGISQWVLGLGHTCRSPRTESSGFGGCTYPGRPDVVQGRVKDVEGLVWSWGTLQRCSGCHVVCQPLHSWLQQGFNGPDICLWWESAHSGWRRSHQDDLWQLAMPGAQSCRLLSRPKCVCCGWVVHGHHAWEVGCMGHGQRWPHSKLWPVWPSIQWANWSHRSARKRQQCHGGRFESDPWCHLWQLHGRCCQWYPVARHEWRQPVETIARALREVSSRGTELHSNLGHDWKFCQRLRAASAHRDWALSQWWHHGTAIGLWPELGLHRPHLWCVALHLCESSAQGRVLHWTMVGQLPMPSHIHEDTGHEPRLGHWVLTNSFSAVPRWGSFAHDLQVLDGIIFHLHSRCQECDLQHLPGTVAKALGGWVSHLGPALPTHVESDWSWLGSLEARRVRCWCWSWWKNLQSLGHGGVLEPPPQFALEPHPLRDAQPTLAHVQPGSCRIWSSGEPLVGELLVQRLSWLLHHWRSGHGWPAPQELAGWRACQVLELRPQHCFGTCCHDTGRPSMDQPFGICQSWGGGESILRSLRDLRGDVACGEVRDQIDAFWSWNMHG